MGFEFSEEDVRRQVSGDGTGSSGVLRSGAKAQVRFRLHAVLDGDATEKRGYPCFREAIFFSRRDVVRGREDGVDREATEEHFREYPEALEQFKEWNKNPQIPVYALPFLPPTVLRLLDEGEITTVQQLAFAPNLTFRDGEGKVTQRVSIDAVPELKDARALAREWIGKRPAHAPTAIPETETERLRRELAEAQARIEAQSAPKKRGGRQPGSKNKPKAAANVKDPQTDS